MEKVERKKKERKKNNAKFSGHYVYPRTETVRAHALRSHQLLTHIKKIHDAEEKSENYRMFLKDQRSKMKTMTQTQLFDLVDKINKRDQTP